MKKPERASDLPGFYYLISVHHIIYARLTMLYRLFHLIKLLPQPPHFVRLCHQSLPSELFTTALAPVSNVPLKAQTQAAHISGRDFGFTVGIADAEIINLMDYFHLDKLMFWQLNNSYADNRIYQGMAVAYEL